MTSREQGSTLVELLVAIGLLGLAMSVVAALAIPILAAFEADPAATDQQQRARTALQVLIDDVQRAGSGFLSMTEDGPGLAMPSLLPDVVTTGPWVVQARPGVLATWHAPRGAAHGVLRAAVAAGAIMVPLARPAYCPAVTPTCGFAAGDEISLVVPHGRFVIATIRQVLPPLDLELTAPLAEGWPVGATASAIVAHTYELRPDSATGLSQIVRRLGSGPATPVIDFVRRFDVEWLVADGAPRVQRAPDGSEEHATSGPRPPSAGVVGEPAWPPGENCAFFRDAAGAASWRGSAGAGAPAPVAPETLADGPWCPAPDAPVRWDADLARLAEVRLLISVAVATTTLRPPLGLGIARRPGARLVPDLVVETTVRPGRRSGGA